MYRLLVASAAQLIVRIQLHNFHCAVPVASSEMSLDVQSSQQATVFLVVALLAQVCALFVYFQIPNL